MKGCLAFLYCCAFAAPLTATDAVAEPNSTALGALPWQGVIELPIALGPGDGRAQLSALGMAAEPAALATADFDEDGVPDLVSGYGVPGGGALFVQRGNLEYFYPLSRSSAAVQTRAAFEQSPFFVDAERVELSHRPDYLMAGDFDGDGHFDLAAVERGGTALSWRKGTGRGTFEPAEPIELPGRVTAVTAGEMNRPDGLTDVIVAVATEAGPKVLIFEGPNGALSRPPEVIALPAMGTALALGQLDEDYMPDLVVAAGRSLFVLTGRDRKLSLDATQQATVLPPSVAVQSFPFTIAALAIGDFHGDRFPSIAVLDDEGAVRLLKRTEESGAWAISSAELRVVEHRNRALASLNWSSGPSFAFLRTARVTGKAADELVIGDRDTRQVRIISVESVAGAADGNGPAVQLSSRSTPLNVDGEPVAALVMRLNDDALDDLVLARSGAAAPLAFAPAAAGTTFTVNSAGSEADGDLTDGRCDTGKAPNFTGICTLRAAIDQANANGGPHTIHFTVPVVTNLVTTAFKAPVTIDGTTSGGKVVWDRELVLEGGNSVVKGMIITSGIRMRTNGNNVIEGNIFQNFGAVLVERCDNNLIGGTTAEARNVIRDDASVYLVGNGNRLKGNYVGTDGTAALGDQPTGLVAVQVWGTNNIIGGVEAGAGNVISGWRNTNGVTALGINTGEGNVVQGNFIGVNAGGTAPLGNSEYGVGIFGGNRTLLGGTTPAARNIISANAFDGVHEQNEGAGNLIQGNYIGTDVSGTIAMGNGLTITRFGTSGQGVSIFSGINNVVGGAVSGAGNLISGNGAANFSAGLTVEAETTIVQGNLIGTDLTGTKPLPNIRGIALYLRTSAFSNVLIGGADPAARNIIASSTQDGILVSGGPGLTIQGNFIGTDISGTKELGNGGNGILLEGANNNIVGGSLAGQGNVIAFNRSNAVAVVNGTRNAIRGNSIFDNQMLGIDLDRNGPTANDPGDGDSGANLRQNYPILTAADGSVRGTLNSTPNTQFIIDFYANAACDPSGGSEGKEFLGSLNVTTDASGVVAFEVPPGENVTATATDPNGNTSEFSPCVGGVPASQGQVWQRVSFPGQLSGLTTNDIIVRFCRTNQGRIILADAPILQLTATNVVVRVPVDLLGPGDVMTPPLDDSERGIGVKIIHQGPPPTEVVVTSQFRLWFPRPLLYDELFIPPARPRPFPVVAPTSRGTLLQFTLADPRLLNDPATAATFVFVGRSTDGLASVRTLNTSLLFPLPLNLEDHLTVFEPNAPPAPAEPPFFLQVAPFQIFNLGFGDEGFQFNVRRDGLHVIAVEAATNSNGPFPAPFQIHLAGNAGLPQKLVNGAPEFPRATRLDTLFNHPAPRPGDLGGAVAAETALFKFANLASVSRFAVAVLIPPTPDGFPLGTPIIRATDPPLTPGADPTIATARTPDCATPALGTVIDFTQLPDPAPVAAMPSVAGTVCATIGVNDGAGVTLPLSIGSAAVPSLIFDMGSGQEIVNGAGPDLRVFALSGSYNVAVANTPYDVFVPLGVTATGTQVFDLAPAGLSAARYVRITAAPNVLIDAVQAINFFADEIRTNEVGASLGPFHRAPAATITTRRLKTPVGNLDPFLQLIAPSGTLFAENESGFGDDISPDRSDSAIREVSLQEAGSYRFLVKGYDKQPDNQSFGPFLARLETSGLYDPADMVVSANNESTTIPQKNGTFSATRQRDSYLFQAVPGTAVSLVVSGVGSPSPLDPLIELYDPEDFLIGANDNAPGRVLNAVLSILLPATGANNQPLPSPSTYRVVVSASDRLGAASPWNDGMAHIRMPATGSYQLKVFTGAIGGSGEPGAPRIESISPTGGPAGTPVLIRGTNFNSAAANNVVRFGGAEALVSSASSTQLVARVPDSVSAGPATLTVETAGRTSNPANFVVVPPSDTEPFLEASGKSLAVFAQFQAPRGAVSDPTGNLFVAGRDSGTLAKISLTGIIAVIAELGREANAWIGPAIDKAGNLFVSHFTRNEVVKVSAQGAVSTFATGIGQPMGLTTDTNGNVYVSSADSGKVFKVTPPAAAAAAQSSVHQALAHSLQSPSLGTVTEYASGLTRPDALVFNSKGELFVANTGTNAISQVARGGGRAVTFAEFRGTPVALAVDRADNLYAAVTAPRGGEPMSVVRVDGDGFAETLASGFENITGLAFTKQDELYIADLAQNRVYKLEPLPIIPGARMAQAHLHSLSLRFQPASVTVSGQNYTLAFNSAFDVESPNGELFPLFFPEGFSHGTEFILDDPTAPDLIAGELNVDVPDLGDSNRNGIPDFYEVQRAVPATAAEGALAIDGEEGTASAIWERAAGSVTGTLRIQLRSIALDQPPEFTMTFELIEYSGTFSYTPSSSVVPGVLQLTQVQRPASTLFGPVQFAKFSDNRLNELSLQSGVLTNSAGLALVFFDGFLERSLVTRTNYSGPVSFLDGDPATPEWDYLDWQMAIEDSADSNSNGIPDLSDDPPAFVAPPKLTLDLAQGNLRLTINGPRGAAFTIEATSALGLANWSPVASGTLNSDSQVVPLLAPVAKTMFYRARVQ